MSDKFTFKKADFENDIRNVSDLWSRAVQIYNETAETPLVVGKFSNTQEMISYGTEEMNHFHKWRHDDKKVDKLRRLFIGNIDYIEAGMKQVVNAAIVSFPPAAAIGTALTLLLSAARLVSADYDVIINFFEDMNNFLQRVSIIATRVPRKQAYQNALLDVFATFLCMIALAHKTISLGRFQKWAINAIFGGDSDLSGGRQKMDLSLERLRSATEFAILDNSENMLDKQEDLETFLAHYQQELLQNQRAQEILASSQAQAIQNISDNLQDCKDDIRKLLDLAQTQQEAKSTENRGEKKTSINCFRAFFCLVADTSGRIRMLEKSRVDGTGTWIFDTLSWSKWMNEDSCRQHSLLIEGPPGIGKTFTSLAIYQYLQQLTQERSDLHACVAYFTFQQDDDLSNSLLNALNSLIVDLSDQYPIICQHFEAKLETDEFFYSVPESTSDFWWDFLLHSVSTAGFQLYLVLDGLDQLRSDEERDQFHDWIRKIDQHGLKVKVVATNRSPTQDGAAIYSEVVRMNKESISPDLRKLIWSRLHNPDSAYEGLRKLKKLTKQKLARKIEQYADGLLYAEQMLRYLGGIARAIVIEKLLNEPLPNDLTGLYQMVLDRAKRKLDKTSLLMMETVVVWIVSAYRSFTLAELNALGRLLFPTDADVVEEKLLDDFSSFFEVSYPSNGTTETDVLIDHTVLFSDHLDISTDAEQTDDKICVKLRERTMNPFFIANASSRSNFIMTESEANSRIFLNSVQIILDSEPGSTSKSARKSILDYAVSNCFTHWTRIKPLECTEQEAIELCSKFVELVTDYKFVEAVVRLPAEVQFSPLLGTYNDQDPSLLSVEFYDIWRTWAEIASRLPLEQEVSIYWSGEPENAIWPIAKSSTTTWLNSTDGLIAERAYRLAVDASANTMNKGMLDKAFDDINEHKEAHIDGVKDVMDIIEEYEIKVSNTIHYPYAAALASRSNYGASNAVYKEALKQYSEKQLLARCCVNLGQNYQVLEDWDQAILWFDKSVAIMQSWLDISLGATGLSDDTIQKSVDQSEALDCMNDTNEHIPASDRRPVWILLSGALNSMGLIKHTLKQHGEAAVLLRQSRLCNPDIVSADALLMELESHWEAGHRNTEMMDTLAGFKAIDRLNLMTSTSLSLVQRIDRDKLLLLASARSQRPEDLSKVYEEVITTLDADEAGVPLRVPLAVARKALQHDNKGAKSLLNQVLDSVAKQYTYTLTEQATFDVASNALNLLSDILLEELSDSTSGTEKTLLSLEVKGLLQRNLVASTAITSSELCQYRLVVARILKKLGPMIEYERIMNKSFEDIIVNLTDSTSENDRTNIFALSKLLFLMPAMQRFCKIVISCFFSELDAKEMKNEDGKQEEEFDATDEENYTICDGNCFPSTLIRYWDPNNPLYFCLVCSNGELCKSCYEIRMGWTREPGSKPETEPSFCCSNGLYLTGPVKGWRGIKNGVIYLDTTVAEAISGDELEQVSSAPVKQIRFRDLLEEIKVAWKKAWEDFWS